MIKLRNLENKYIPPRKGNGFVDYNSLPVKKIQGGRMFGNVYSNIFLCAQTNSGKSVCIQTILKHCSNRNTKIIFFVPTFEIDSQYESIRQMLDKKKIEYIHFGHFITDDGVNQIDNLLEMLEEKKIQEREEIERKKEQRKKNNPEPVDITQIRIPSLAEIVLADEIKAEEKKEEKKVTKKKRKPKKLAPEYILVFDDLTDMMRHPSINKLLKKNRHYKLKCILSSQYFKDLMPSAIANLYYMLLFKNLSEDILKTCYNKIRPPNLTFDQFKNLYHKATAKDYSFLYIDIKKWKYRVNFNRLIN